MSARSLTADDADDSADESGDESVGLLSLRFIVSAGLSLPAGSQQGQIWADVKAATLFSINSCIVATWKDHMA